MSIALAEGEVGNFQECVHRDLLTYVSYPAFKGASRRFAYPQFLVEGEQFTLLEKSAFPDNGCLPMVVSRITPHEMKEMFGSLVVMTVNDEHPGLNRNYPEHEQSRYNSIIDPYFAKGASSVEFTPLAKHPLSGLLVQVLEIQEAVDLSHALDQPVHGCAASELPQTKLAMVAQGVGEQRRYYGPFETTAVEGNGIQLHASTAWNLSIGVFEEADFDFSVDIVNDSGALVAQFVSAEELESLFATSSNVIDWISDGELLDALGRVSRTGEASFTKAQMRALKSGVAECADEQAKLTLTPERRERMLGLLSNYESWTSLPNAVKDSVIEHADAAQLAEYVLSNDHFRAFYDKVLENDLVRERVEEEKARYAAEAVEAKTSAEQAQKELRQVKEELEHFDSELGQRRAAFEREMASQVQKARDERNSLAEEVEKLQQQKQHLEQDNVMVQRKIEEAVASFSNDEVLTGKILENSVLQQVVSGVNSGPSCSVQAAKGGNLSERVAGRYPISEDDGSDAAALLDTVTSRINECFGRDMGKNDVANVLICLAQGYITTFAGLPGTGKTSLVNILAEVLGLKNAAAQRFVEVPVEKGWTSYKDFIGYYNPFSKSLEKSNASVFDALSLLSAESAAQLAPGEVAPYLVLLDEANLSSVEHYWSPFLRACDSFRKGPFELSLGGNHAFAVPTYLRFVATVNFDHTTEELSPRFLDRSWVVTLDPQTFEPEDTESALQPFDAAAADAYSYQAIQAAFGAKGSSMLSVELKAKLKEVLDLCARHRYPVSPRSQKMMLEYAYTASGLMDCSSAQMQYAPVDYAISQKVLPVLSGTEERLGGLLQDLSAVGGLPLTKARVEHMLEAGEDSGYFQYFA